MEPFDIGVDDVHPHTAAGHIGDNLGRGEAREEDVLKDRFVAGQFGGFSADQPLLYGFAPEGGAIDAFAIIAELNNDLTTFMIGFEANVS